MLNAGGNITTVTHVGQVLTRFIINRSAQWCLSIVVNRGGFMVYDGNFGSSVASTMLIYGKTTCYCLIRFIIHIKHSIWYKHLTPYHKYYIPNKMPISLQKIRSGHLYKWSWPGNIFRSTDIMWEESIGHGDGFSVVLTKRKSCSTSIYWNVDIDIQTQVYQICIKCPQYKVTGSIWVGMTRWTVSNYGWVAPKALLLRIVYWFWTIPWTICVIMSTCVLPI